MKRRIKIELGFAVVSVDDLGFGWKSKESPWVVEFLYSGEKTKKPPVGRAWGIRIELRFPIVSGDDLGFGWKSKKWPCVVEFLYSGEKTKKRQWDGHGE